MCDTNLYVLYIKQLVAIQSKEIGIFVINYISYYIKIGDEN